MYKEIDELVEAICHDDIYREYAKAEESLNDENVVLLLSRHQILQEDYLRIKQLEGYVSSDDLKQQLKDVKTEMIQNPIIQNYYQRYYQMNELLDEVTIRVFQGISEELTFDKFQL
ncbi:MAG: YlbF family regulator [Coprobacillus sp.]